LGWPGFFVVTIAIALPGLAMLRLRRAEIEALDRSPGET
jgi:PAT family beta-lactamase induction signal transducer AmpG